MNPKIAIEVASEIAIDHWGDTHEKADDLRVEVARHKLKLKEDNPKMSIAEVELRTEATELYRDYLKAKHKVDRVEEIIRIAKAHAHLSSGF